MGLLDRKKQRMHNRFSSLIEKTVREDERILSEAFACNFRLRWAVPFGLLYLWLRVFPYYVVVTDRRLILFSATVREHPTGRIRSIGLKGIEVTNFRSGFIFSVTLRLYFTRKREHMRLIFRSEWTEEACKIVEALERQDDSDEYLTDETEGTEVDATAGVEPSATDTTLSDPVTRDIHDVASPQILPIGLDQACSPTPEGDELIASRDVAGLLSVLGGDLPGPRNVAARVAAANALGRLDDPGLIEKLEACLVQIDTWERLWMGTTSVFVTTPDVPALQNLYAAESSEIRAQAEMIRSAIRDAIARLGGMPTRHCDVCSVLVRASSGTSYPRDAFARLVASGFAPPSELIARLADDASLTPKDYLAGWKKNVELDNTDWFLCTSCITRAPGVGGPPHRGTGGRGARCSGPT